MIFSHVFIILDGYVMALIKHTDKVIYVFDSHADARCNYGMLDANEALLLLYNTAILCFENTHRSILLLRRTASIQFIAHFEAK